MTPYKIAIRNNFSRYAADYDAYANIQRHSAHLLLERIIPEGVNRILEIGCGTGNFTHMLHQRFGYARICSVDISQKMIERAQKKVSHKRVHFYTADAETFMLPETFDSIVSNATLQWFEDLKGSFSRLHHMLASEGQIAFSMFGPRTFYELHQVLRQEMKKKDVLASQKFASLGDMNYFMHQQFRNVTVEEIFITEQLDSLKTLLKKIQCTGTVGAGTGEKRLWTPARLRRMENDYHQQFGDIVATYQLFLCTGQK